MVRILTLFKIKFLSIGLQSSIRHGIGLTLAQEIIHTPWTDSFESREVLTIFSIHIPISKSKC